MVLKMLRSLVPCLWKLASFLFYMMDGDGPAALPAVEVAPIGAGGGVARPGDGWAHVALSHDASMKPSWTCN